MPRRTKKGPARTARASVVRARPQGRRTRSFRADSRPVGLDPWDGRRFGRDPPGCRKGRPYKITGDLPIYQAFVLHGRSWAKACPSVTGEDSWDVWRFPCHHERRLPNALFTFESVQRRETSSWCERTFRSIKPSRRASCVSSPMAARASRVADLLRLLPVPAVWLEPAGRATPEPFRLPCTVDR